MAFKPKERTPLETLRFRARMHSLAQMHHRDRIGHPQFDDMHQRIAIKHQRQARQLRQEIDAMDWGA
jgi:hypothetical protein